MSGNYKVPDEEWLKALEKVLEEDPNADWLPSDGKLDPPELMLTDEEVQAWLWRAKKEQEEQ